MGQCNNGGLNTPRTSTSVSFSKRTKNGRLVFQPLITAQARNPKWTPGIEISMEPLRQVIGRSSQINNGWHRTNKHPKGYLPGESRPELALFLVLAEMDPNITVVAAQPAEIPFSHDGKACRHFPDYAVIEAGESVLYEVKTARKYAEREVVRRLSGACRSVEARGWSYFVAIDTEMKSDRRFKAAEDLWRRHRPIFTERQRLAVERAVGSGEKPIADIVSALSGMGDEAPTLHTVLSLAANARLFIDLTRPIGRESLVRRADPEAMPEPLLPRRRPIEDLDRELAA
jgi:hypothetical protein